jgi:hypothetical protein
LSKDKKRERERLNKLEIQNKLKEKLSNFIARQKNFRDRNFWSRMLELRLQRRLESLRLISNSLNVLKRPPKRLRRELLKGKSG